MEPLHTHDESLRTFFDEERKRALAHAAISPEVRPVTPEEMDAPHEFNGFGD